jgi:hypothetical protein
MQLRGPAGLPLWGEQRDYTWFVRDGFFVRSPLKVNGAAVSDDDRRQYEGAFLRHAIEREKRANPNADATASAADSADDPGALDVDGLIRQTRQPQFISSAYFLRFKFDAGRYAFVGRERVNDHDVLRIEYYPTDLFRESERRQRRNQRSTQARDDSRYDRAVMQLMNKTSKVTMWIEPASHQIVKYTFDDLGWDFFPGAWLVRVSDVTASMMMDEAFPDIWLPRSMDVNIQMMLAVGAVDVAYSLAYHDYRQPDVTSQVGFPGR